MKRVLIAAVAALSLASGAQASDLFSGKSTSDDYRAPHNWTGLWIGAVGGYEFNTTEAAASLFDDDESLAGASVDGLGSQGLFGELQIGYDQHVTKSLLIGVFAGYNIDDAVHSIDANFGGTGGNILSYSQDWGAVFGPRIGWVKGDTMWYAAGGAAIGEVDPITIGGTPLPHETDLEGWFVEGGVEHLIAGTNNIYVKGAVRYTDYSKFDVFNNINGDGDGIVVTADRDDLAAMIGLTVKLGIGQ